MDRHSAAVVFGGPMSANDDNQFSFIRDELTWIPTVLAAEKPYLGYLPGGAATGQSPGGQSQASS